MGYGLGAEGTLLLRWRRGLRRRALLLRRRGDEEGARGVDAPSHHGCQVLWRTDESCGGLRRTTVLARSAPSPPRAAISHFGFPGCPSQKYQVSLILANLREWESSIRAARAGPNDSVIVNRALAQRDALIAWRERASWAHAVREGIIHPGLDPGALTLEPRCAAPGKRVRSAL
eukprot:gene14184-biopygen7003